MEDEDQRINLMKPWEGQVKARGSGRRTIAMPRQFGMRGGGTDLEARKLKRAVGGKTTMKHRVTMSRSLAEGSAPACNRRPVEPAKSSMPRRIGSPSARPGMEAAIADKLKGG
jgi:hypothetical protein